MVSDGGADPQELARYVGDVSQVVSTRAARLLDGDEDGVRVIDARASGGLSALILADRGLDLGPVWAAGHQVSWQSTTGIVHPDRFSEAHWLRSFHGGLLTTCGLQNVGLPSEEDGVTYGLHGRISNIAARDVRHRVVEIDGVLTAEVSGELRETDVFGSDLRLRRRLRLPTGDTVVHLHDEIVNAGHAPAPVMVLYHVNVGHPVVAETTRLITPPVEVIGRDDRAEAARDERATFPPPQDGFEEYVYEYRVERADAPTAITLANPAFAPTDGIAVSLEYDPRQLPRLWQWRMLGPGMYLTGLEPANCGLAGRAAERAAGDLDIVEPGDRRSVDLSIRVHLGEVVTDLVTSAVTS